MTFQELPKKVQEQLTKERHELAGSMQNDAYSVHIYDSLGSRYFYAKRRCRSWNDDKGNSMPFGGGTYWIVKYGAVQFRKYRNPVGEIDYELCDGKSYGKSSNGTFIPKQVSTKKEVLDIVRRIGIFNL